MARRSNDLGRFERREFSQNGEDGILEEMLRRLGVGTGTAVEIGASDGEENITRALVERGWPAVWIEGDPAKAEHAATLGEGRVTCLAALVTAENVDELLEKAGAPAAPEVLALDIDGNDFWVLDAVLRTRSPRIVVAEYNGSVGGPSWWVQPYEPDRGWDRTAWHGAGLLALDWLMSRHGYALVGCDANGVNAFFVRTDDAAAFRPGRACDHFVPPGFSLPFGHPWSPIPELDADADPDALTLRPLLRRRSARPGRSFLVPLVATNTGEQWLSSFDERRPVLLAVRWAPEGEPDRRYQAFVVPPGKRRLVGLEVVAPVAAGPHRLQVFAVQEGVLWFGGQPRRPLAEVVITVKPSRPSSLAALLDRRRRSAAAGG